MQKPDLILIDLDGTLVDSVPDLAKAVDAMMLDIGEQERGENVVRNWVGNGVERLVKRALTQELYAEPEQAKYDQAYPIFYQYYQDYNGKFSRLFDGIAEGLAVLQKQGYALACVTNKAEAFTLPLLEALGILSYFKIVVSGDTTAHKKPHPEPLLHAAKFFNADPHQCLMIGDSQHDVEAARNAGFQVICVTYGYNHGEDIADSKPDGIINSLAELPTLLA